MLTNCVGCGVLVSVHAKRGDCRACKLDREIASLRVALARAEAMMPTQDERDAISYCAKIACRELVEESTIAEAYVERLEAARVEGEG